MKHLITLFSTIALAMGCTKKDNEGPASVIKAKLKPALCAFPENYVTQEAVISGIDCLELNLDQAFANLQGKVEGELSVAEIRRLHDEGIVALPIQNQAQWNSLEGFASMVHPEGKPALSKFQIKRFTGWLKTKASTLAKMYDLNNHRGILTPFQYDFYRELIAFAEELVPFVSENGSLTFDQFSAPFPESAQRLSALWQLRPLLFANTTSESPLTGRALRPFLQMAVRLARETDATYQWWETDFHPRHIPQNIETEWNQGLEIAKAYFKHFPAGTIRVEAIALHLKTLMPQAELPELIPNLTLASTKLAEHRNEANSGFIYGLLHLFDESEIVAKHLRDAAMAFAACERSETCFINIEDALKTTTLKPVTMVSASDWNSNNKTGLTWKTVMKRLLERGVINNIFAAFDENRDAKIPYTSDAAEHLSEATDIAFTLNSILTSSRTPGTQNQAITFHIKPSTFIGAVGLIADRWVYGGNGDGNIDADEFYSAVKVYEDINYIARTSSMTLSTFVEAFDPKAKIYVQRPSFIAQMGTVYQNELPALVEVFKQFDPNDKDSAKLLDLIVPKHSQKKTFLLSRTKEPLSIDYIDRQDMVMPVALLVMLDRLIVKCDRNGDKLFSYSELECVAPLVSDTGKLFLKSDLMPLPPFVGDGAKLALDTLEKKGLPQTLRKLILINGGVEKMRITPATVTKAKVTVKASTQELAAVFAALSDSTDEQLRTDISVAIIATNSSASGAWRYYIRGGDPNSKDTINSEAAWDSVLKNIMDSSLGKVAKATDGLIDKDELKELWTNWDDTAKNKCPRIAALKPLIELAIVVGAQEQQGDTIFTPISPANLLGLLRELVR